VLFIDPFFKVVSKKRAKGICGGVLIGMYSKSRKAGLSRVMLRMDLKVLEMTRVLKSSTGSLHILNLFEFSLVLVFDNDELLIVDCLEKCANMWLDALAEGRDAKSGLWYITRQTYVPWENYDYEEPERLSISEYRLGDLN